MEHRAPFWQRTLLAQINTMHNHLFHLSVCLFTVAVEQESAFETANTVDMSLLHVDLEWPTSLCT